MTHHVTNTESKSAPYRINLALTPEAKNELEEMKVLAQKSSYTDVLRSALALFKVILLHQKAGGRVVFRDINNEEETLRLM